MFRKSIYTIGVMLAVMLIASIFIGDDVFASQQQQQQQQPPSEYVVLWPDGYSEKFTIEKYGSSEKAKEAAEAAAAEWKLLYTGTSDPKGLVTLKDWLTSGQIKIEETKAPKGYKPAETRKIVELEDGKTTFVNIAEGSGVAGDGSGADDSAVQDEEDDAKEEKGSGAKTGDDSFVLLCGLLLALTSVAMGTMYAVRRRATR